MQTTKKAAFLIARDPDVFVRNEKQKRGWMPHSVSLLALSPRAEHVMLGKPKQWEIDDNELLRVPPQARMKDLEAVLTKAHSLTREAASFPVAFNQLNYLGSSRGVHGNDLYGKWIHWVGVQLPKYKNVFNKSSEKFGELEWCSYRKLLDMDGLTMSDRKYLMVMQALTAFNNIGVESRLTLAAHRRLSSAA